MTIAKDKARTYETFIVKASLMIFTYNRQNSFSNTGHRMSLESTKHAFFILHSTRATALRTCWDVAPSAASGAALANSCELTLKAASKPGPLLG